MTESCSSRRGRVDGAEMANESPPTNPPARTDELGELLGRVRQNVVLFVSETPRLPRVLRVRAGEVSVDVEWAQEHIGTAGGAELAVAPVTEPVAETDTAAHYLNSPAVGVLYLAPEPGAAPFVSEGDTVVAGQQVGIIEAMKLMIPVEADKAGHLIEVLKNNGEPVEYGERLFAFAVVEAV